MSLPSDSQHLGRVAIATCAEVADKEPEDLRLIEELGSRGIQAAHTVWDDATIDWPSFSLVVVRSTWDYPARRDAFLEWAARQRRILNPLSILRWNTHKRYLDDLAAAGIPVIPTRFLECGQTFDVPDVPFVVKPAVSCSAKDTARYVPEDFKAALEHVHRLQAAERTVMIQPYRPEIEARGEVAVLFIGGVYSHSIRRGAILKDAGAVHNSEVIPANIRSHEATPEERSLAELALSKVPGGPAGLLYARVDLVPGPDGKPEILEVELTEPTLFLSFSQGGVERLADCIVSALRFDRI
jgi:glutathione synthase/RimK-type ligase-like ATP-grasp enzyme